jgi:hypothetical protein
MNETGVGIKNPLFFIGVVENRNDERLEGRVQVRAFGVHGTVNEIPSEDLPWAITIAGSYDANIAPPPLNSWVFGFFLDGRDAQHPMILGLIPTQMSEIINPEVTGWGVIPSKDANVQSQGSRPEDFGQPAQSRLMRGENIEETYVLNQEMNRIKDVSTAGTSGTSWEEPSTAYNSQYPYNRVIETAGGHSIELDDTPGAERIMIYHKSGSFVQIDSNGTKVDKSISDKYEINHTNQHVYVGGKSLVTIQGDSHILVNGNKTEEITGDYIQLIHGNHMMSVAGQSNFNASDEIQMRAAKIRFESNVEGINLKSGKDIKIESGQSLHMKAGVAIFQNSENSINIKSGANIFIEASGTGNIKATQVNIDDIVNMANGAAGDATAAIAAEGTSLPEPTSKSVSTTGYRNTSSFGSSGYASQDDGFSADGLSQLDESVTEGALKVLLDLIGLAEGAGYDTVFGGSKIKPNKPITTMTIAELLDWQDRSVSAGSTSSAAGRYQVIRGTLRTVLNSGLIALNDMYNPTTQDKIAIYLLKIRGLNRFISGSLTKEGFADNLAKEWASFPVVTGPAAGRSFYQGIAGNKSRTTPHDVFNALDSIKNYEPSAGNPPKLDQSQIALREIAASEQERLDRDIAAGRL